MYVLYSRATASGGGTIKSSTTKAGGQSVQSSTTNSGGQSVQSSTTQSGGQSVQSETTSSAAPHRHLMFDFMESQGAPPPSSGWNVFAYAQSRSGFQGLIDLPTSNPVYTYSADGQHSHSVNVNIPSHNHDFSINIPSHKHDFSVNIPAHTHDFEFELDPHKHDIEYGIFELDRLPTELEITVDGNKTPYTELKGENIDLTPYLKKDSDGKIQRDRYAVIEIRPKDELAQITATIVWGVFIQSRKGGRY
ncbi:hypothetical protein [Piscibacillus halophilus]|uniref:hypothetical protein n=1 Tax=Piscibacillus halophilus TaxID=571933 RepID=UPI00158EB0B2|nr:hypothetical protein [Piscibacillus halophilus]